MSYGWLWVGLGNPGFDYSVTRHNVGFMVLDFLKNIFEYSQTNPFREFQKKNALLTAVTYKEHQILLCKPLSYMNLSGNVVLELLKLYDIPLDRLVVFHDELELAFGTQRWRFGGGHRGHNGVRHISARCGTDYGRFRIGIGRPPGAMEVSKFVLSDFTSQERLRLDASIFPSIQRALPWILQQKSHEISQALQEDKIDSSKDFP
ncbi:aminoacyl-tRNA hydrolase [Holospora curviuscula]|uniref:Peptidyl-tRNA hydrolase n=1 Tax=Holospora curviuscula TaxID=1082868 RepID=A0A2S5RA64_9PROT|nr:aminoacyl-tRNA hydrolase [Holospora curviuscula]PPE04190.1 Peptidyl-tRNA hydrolase [Holospora curviuscula]